MQLQFKRVLTKGDHGSDVEGVGRALCRAGVFLPLRVFNALPKKMRQTYGFRKIKAVKKLQRKYGLIQKDGVYRKKVHDKLEPFFDAKAALLYKSYQVQPPKPKLVVPRQGLNSLHRSLWEAFSIGRNMGFSDLGTYNPGSRLPSGAPSDHAKYPARAYDLGISPATGWNNDKARKYFLLMIHRPEVKYIILGDKIWSAGRGIHGYYSGGHSNHIHVSGY